MREFTEVLSSASMPEDAQKITLTFLQREKSRLKATLPDGEDIGLFLPRGTVLKEGDVLTNEDGDFLEVKAADEKVSTVTADDAFQLARIAYHLGNRHVPLQLSPGWLRYAHDHVLDEMVELLGGKVLVEDKPLHPESGAYGAHGGGHGGGHGHGHHHH